MLVIALTVTPYFITNLYVEQTFSKTSNSQGTNIVICSAVVKFCERRILVSSVINSKEII